IRGRGGLRLLSLRFNRFFGGRFWDSRFGLRRLDSRRVFSGTRLGRRLFFFAFLSFRFCRLLLSGCRRLFFLSLSLNRSG
ncbi:hypothetical protein, partial [Klebsiella pneumoniae]|uniref:hypothetical protein n=1 Tax=Klebsiella pneumoniae TaxID=573 RepID=UPI0027307105